MPINPVARFSAPQSPVYRPSIMDILSISNDEQAVIVTTYDGVNPGNHNYQTGLIVRLLVPGNWGMNQINDLKGTITVLSPTSFSIPINTMNFDPFVIPSLQPGFNYTPSQVVPIGEVNEQLNQAVQNILPPLGGT